MPELRYGVSTKWLTISDLFEAAERHVENGRDIITSLHDWHAQRLRARSTTIKGALLAFFFGLLGYFIGPGRFAIDVRDFVSMPILTSALAIMLFGYAANIVTVDRKLKLVSRAYFDALLLFSAIKWGLQSWSNLPLDQRRNLILYLKREVGGVRVREYSDDAGIKGETNEKLQRYLQE